jgi:hypothetical protein
MLIVVFIHKMADGQTERGEASGERAQRRRQSLITTSKLISVNMLGVIPVFLIFSVFSIQ